MQNADNILKGFTTKVRQLIIRNGELKKENGELAAVAKKRETEITELKQELEAQKKQYDALMMAKMINITDGDIEATRRRIQKLIRSVNKCIMLLNGNEEQGSK